VISGTEGGSAGTPGYGKPDRRLDDQAARPIRLFPFVFGFLRRFLALYLEFVDDLERELS
jgi:hypothetical protein